MPRVIKKENLIPIKTTEQAKKLGAKGGVASGIAKREKAKMSQIYGDFLAEMFEVKMDGISKNLTGAQFVNAIIKRVMLKGDSASVSLMKEIREATEGNKLLVEAKTINIKITPPPSPEPLEDER
jgi:hypothetical protein